MAFRPSYLRRRGSENLLVQVNSPSPVGEVWVSNTPSLFEPRLSLISWRPPAAAEPDENETDRPGRVRRDQTQVQPLVRVDDQSYSLKLLVPTVLSEASDLVSHPTLDTSATHPHDSATPSSIAHSLAMFLFRPVNLHARLDYRAPVRD